MSGLPVVDRESNTTCYFAVLDDLLRSGAIKGCSCAPPPKRQRPAYNRGNGRAVRWLLEHVDFDENKCLFWPFSKDQGYAKNVGYQGKVYRAARLMCTLAHGAPPSDEHETAYSCGRGDKGCINPKHLCWKTRSENQRDQAKLGRVFPGRQGKITFAQAAEIRMIGHSRTLKDVSEQYGISQQRVSGILRGQGFTRPVKPWALRDRRFYPRIVFKGITHSLGGFETSEAATAAYHLALERLRRGESAKPELREKPNPTDLRRLYTDHAVRFENEGNRILAIGANQEQSVYLLHNALNDVHPSVKKFIIAASATGDLEEAAVAAGLNQQQVAAILPRVRVYLQRHLQ